MREAALLLLCIAFGLGVHLGLHLHDAPAPHTTTVARAKYGLRRRSVSGLHRVRLQPRCNNRFKRPAKQAIRELDER